MLRFIVSEQGQPELPGIDLDGRVVIGSSADAHVRLPAAAAQATHVVIDGGRWRAHGDVEVNGVAHRPGDEGDIGGARADAATVARGAPADAATVSGGGAAGSAGRAAIVTF